MVEAFHAIDSNTIVTYTFRFDSSDKLVHLTQQQLASIPYLNALLAHKDDMSLTQNENGEYILNPPIYYQWFLPILHSITSKNPYTLFNEVPEDNNILETLQLFDYLCIKSFPLPLLKFEDLVRSNPTDSGDQNHHIEYHKANLSEARQTAAEFVIALAKNEYKLHDSDTKKSIFTLINIILFNTAIFNSRFRHHTLTVVKKRCYSFFSKSEQRQLQTTVRIAQNRKTRSSVYLSDDVELLPDKFQNTFTWRSGYVPTEETNVHHLFRRSELMLDWDSYFYSRNYRMWRSFGYLAGLLRSIVEVNIPTEEQVENEAKVARSGGFNTLPKRPNVDKFKHRSGPKAQKYR